MRTSACVIPDRGLGPLRCVPAVQLDDAAILRVLSSASADCADITVALSPRAGTTGYDLSLEGSYLGLFPSEAAAEYAFLPDLISNGLTPLATVRARRLPDERAELSLHLPEPHLCLPLNDPPPAPWVLFPDGELRLISYDPAAFPPLLSPASGPSNSAAHVLVSLSFDTAGEIVASIDGSPVGALESRDAAQLAPALRKVENWHTLAVARGYLDPAEETLTICADPPGECTDPAPQPAVSAVPGLARPVPANGEVPAPEPRAAFLAEQDARDAALQAEHHDVPPAAPRGKRAAGIVAIAGFLILSAIGVTTLVGHTRASDSDACNVIEVVRNSAEFDGAYSAPAPPCPGRRWWGVV